MNLIPSLICRFGAPLERRFGPAGMALAALGSLAGTASAELGLPALIADGMVLQQESQVAIWGTAEPGEQVLIVGTWDGQAMAGVKALAGPEGRWSAVLSTPAASGNAGTVEISTDSESLLINDVLLGEVWLCSGQSNMEWTLDRSIDAARASEDLAPEDTALALSSIRHFTVPRTFAGEPVETTGGRWVEAAGDGALSCSAAAYFFARQIQAELGVPVGLVVSSWGGTTAQAWTSKEVITAFPNHAKTLAAVEALVGRTGMAEAQLDEYWDKVNDAAFFSARFSARDFDDRHWATASIPSTYADLGLGSFDGVVWYRREVEVPPSWAGSDLSLELPPIDDLDETFWNGERVGSLVASGSWSKKRRYTIPASAVTGGKATLVIRALDTGGLGGFGAGQMKLSHGEEWIDLAGEWRYRRGVPASRAGRPPVTAALNHHTPSSLYNAMIAPLVPYGLRGDLWYQGESNRNLAAQYGKLFPAMIMDWRSQWNDLNLPFYFVQIAPYDYGSSGDGAELMAILREGQSKTTRLPMTGMALTADIGNPSDIHPLNKWEVGRRLALFALRDIHGRDDLEPNGPTITAASRDGAQLILHFAHLAGGLTSAHDSLTQFEIKNAAGAFVKATASISPDGQSITVSADGVARPMGARYLWNDAGEACVYGGTGLPMAPFRTSNVR